MKILFVVSSADPGFWLSELTHLYWQLFFSRPCEIEIASPAGGSIHFDPMSDPYAIGTWASDDLVSRGFLSDAALAQRLSSTSRLQDVSAADFEAIHIVGGRGAGFDLYPNIEVARLLDDFMSAGKLVGAIGEGVVALANVPRYLAGRRATGSSRWEDAELEEVHGYPEMPYWPQLMLEKAGVDFIHDRTWGRRVMVDGRMVTGQNHISTQSYSAEFERMLFGSGVVLTTYRDENFPSMDAVAAE